MGALFALLCTIMTRLAQGLPVRPIPKQLIVTPVRRDVVHHGRQSAAANANRVVAQKLYAGFAPFVVIPAYSGCRPVRIVAFISGTGAGDLTRTALAMRHNAPAGTDVRRLRH